MASSAAVNSINLHSLGHIAAELHLEPRDWIIARVSVGHGPVFLFQLHNVDLRINEYYLHHYDGRRSQAHARSLLPARLSHYQDLACRARPCSPRGSSHLVVQDGGARGKVVREQVVGEGHPRVVVVDAAHAKLADVLVEREAVESHGTHERYVGRLRRRCQKYTRRRLITYY